MARLNNVRVKLCDKILLRKIDTLNKAVLQINNSDGTPVVKEWEMEMAFKKSINYSGSNFFSHRLDDAHISIIYIIIFLILLFFATPILVNLLEIILGMRCIVPNNYLVWEATRPVSNCDFCRGIDKPTILKNLTREEFKPYAYSSKPIIIKNAVSNWRAAELLNFTFLKDLYLKHPEALDSVQDDCQFLHFKSNFQTLKDVFKMSSDRAALKKGQLPWYVGWSNCNPSILNELRKLYPKPHFLPEDAEMPNTDFIFLGYEQGAIMHLDYIPRLMWQAQLRGNKSWILAPTAECDLECTSFSFYVEPGDALLLDTRLWYHGTFISKGEFSLTIQSEYG